MGEAGFTPEQLAEQIRQLKVADILLSTVTTLGQLTYVKLDAAQLDDARLAIDGIAALLPVLEGRADAQAMRDFNQLLANVRLAYASRADASGAPVEEPDQEGDGATTDTPPGPME